MKYTVEQMVEAIKGSGGLVSVIAQRLGCGRATVYRYVSRYQSVREALDSERAVLLDRAESELFRLIGEGNVQAIIFALKTLGKDRGYTERVDVGAYLKEEMEAVLDVLERGLTPEEFRKVAVLLADEGNYRRRIAA
jgi:hypothetical protein